MYHGGTKAGMLQPGTTHCMCGTSQTGMERECVSLDTYCNYGMDVHSARNGLQGLISGQGRGLHFKREREIHYVHWASKAYEDESVFMSEAHLGWQCQV